MIKYLDVKWVNAGLQIFSRLVGRSDPWGQKMVGHFLKWWAQAYQTNHRWHLGCILYLHTDTDKSMHICILIADYIVKPVLSDHSKKKTNSLLNAGQKYCRMLQGEHSAILLAFIKLPFVIKIFVLSILSGCLRHVLLYWLPTCTFCFVEFVDLL